MKKLLFLAALMAAGIANAATTVNFAAATDGSYFCSTYCTGFTTDDPGYAIGYVNVQYNGGGQYHVTFSVNGVAYGGYSNGNGTGFTAGAASANVTWTETRTCTHSGRGQTCTTHYHAVSGSVTL